MEYKIENKVVLEANDIITIDEDISIYNSSIDDTSLLTKGSICKVIRAKKYRIQLRVLHSFEEPRGKYIEFTQFSPAEEVEFDNFLTNIHYTGTPELQEMNVPMEYWSIKHLKNYIAFLEDRPTD